MIKIKSRTVRSLVYTGISFGLFYSLTFLSTKLYPAFMGFFDHILNPQPNTWDGLGVLILAVLFAGYIVPFTALMIGLTLIFKKLFRQQHAWLFAVLPPLMVATFFFFEQYHYTYWWDSIYENSFWYYSIQISILIISYLILVTKFPGQGLKKPPKIKMSGAQLKKLEKRV